MDKCQDIRGRIALYLDDELQGSDRLEIEKHLHHCEACSSRVESERRFLEAIRASRPLHKAPDELRARVQKTVSDAKHSENGPAYSDPRILKSNTRFTFTRPRLAIGAVAAVIAVLVIALLVVWVSPQPERLKSSRPSEFALMAADTHLRHLRGQLPLEIVSAEPDQISGWFHDKLAFSVKLPNYQESSGQEKLYELEGARLVGYENDYAAYVAYQMQRRPISLVITSSQTAEASGGEEIVAKGLTFHYNSINGLKVLTWTDRGLTYALVSDLEERGQQSCVVCHQGGTDQDFIEPLKPKS